VVFHEYLRGDKDVLKEMFVHLSVYQAWYGGLAAQPIVRMQACEKTSLNSLSTQDAMFRRTLTGD
jgi:hypothetical protein